LKRSGGEEELFCSCESGVHGRSPGKSFGSTTEGISERAEYTGDVGKKTAVEIEESQKTLELFNGSGSRKILNGSDVGVHRRNASGGNGVAEVGDR
jgi:hypothetical protein